MKRGIDLQLFGGRGAGSGGREGGGGSLGASDIYDTTSLISEGMSGNEKMTGEILSVCRDVYDEYGLQVNDLDLATINPAKPAIAYYDGSNVGWNKTFFDEKKLESSYADCVKNGFHPSNGKKTAAEAVAAHELGHALTDKAARKMGTVGIDATATAIVKEARKQTKHKGVVQMARGVSRYATHSNAEAIAEAFSDVYCNGKKAKSESIAIVNVLNKYAK